MKKSPNIEEDKKFLLNVLEYTENFCGHNDCRQNYFINKREAIVYRGYMFERCYDCRNFFCMEHIKDCWGCGRSTCEDCVKHFNCPSCSYIFCNECHEDHEYKICDKCKKYGCEMEYNENCEKCKSIHYRSMSPLKTYQIEK